MKNARRLPARPRMDFDHNRCVITLVGEREAIQEAAIRGVGRAAEVIDLNLHTGAHPRRERQMSFPSSPSTASRLKMRGYANHVGEQIGSAIRFPFIYTKPPPGFPSARGLENIRRGQSKASARRSRLTRRAAPTLRASCTSHGLVQRWWARANSSSRINVFLTRPTVEIAKKKSQAVRFSNGGMRFCKGRRLPGPWPCPGLDESY